MWMDEAAEAELRDLVGRLDRLVPREDAHLAVPPPGERGITVGNRRGYLRLGIEVLRAAANPAAGSDAAAPRIVPDVAYLTGRRPTAFDACELDEAVASRPPVVSPLGALTQLALALVAVAALVLAFMGLSAFVNWILR